MLKRWFVFALIAWPVFAGAQVASHGPLYISGKDRRGFDVFMVVCGHDHCIGPHGQPLGTWYDVLPYLPYIPAHAIDAHGFSCLKVCIDRAGNLIGKPSPDYRSIFSSGA